MNVARRAPNCKKVDRDRIVVAGGKGGTNNAYLDTMEVFSLQTLSWSAEEPLPASIFCCGATSIANAEVDLFVFGGQGRMEIYYYDPLQSKMVLRSERLGFGRANHAVVRLPDDAFVC